MNDSVGVIHWQKHQWRRLRKCATWWSHPKEICIRGKNRPSAATAGHQQHNICCFFAGISWPTASLEGKCATVLGRVGDSFTTRQPPGNSHCPCIKWVTMAIYYQSRRGVSEYCGHRHNGAAVTGRSTQLVHHKVGRMRLSRMQQLAALDIK